MVKKASARLRSIFRPLDQQASVQGPIDLRLGRWLQLGRTTALIAALTLLLVHYANFIFLNSPLSFLDANSEGTVWSWASALATGTVTAAALLGICVEPARLGLFLSLSAVCAFLSLDDMVALHERVAEWAYETLRIAETWDSIIWPVLYFPLLFIAFLGLLRISRASPPQIRATIKLGLWAFVLALALEIISAPWSTDDNLVHIVEGGVEEALELAGWLLAATGTLAAVISPLTSDGASANGSNKVASATNDVDANGRSYRWRPWHRQIEQDMPIGRRVRS